MSFDGFLEQGATLTISLGPFVDKDDGDTEKTGLTIEDTDVYLSVNGGAKGNPNDTNDCTEDAHGIYRKQLNGTDTGTAGRLSVYVHFTDCLYVRQNYIVLDPEAYAGIVTGTAFGTDDKMLVSTNAQDLSGTLDVNTKALGGTVQSASDLKDFADAGYDPNTNKVQGVVLVDTTTTNSDMVTAPPTAAAIVDEWESQSQADPTGFHVNVMEWLSQACAAVSVNGVPEVDLTHVMGTILSEGGAGRLATAIIKLFDVATPVLVTSDVMRGTDNANTTVPDAAGVAPTVAEIVNEWETQSQADPTGFHVNVKEVNGAGQTANDNGADINTLLTRITALIATKAQIDTAHGLLATPAQVASELGTYDAPTKAEMDTAHALLATPANVAAELGTYDAPTKAEMDTAHALLTTPAQVASALTSYDAPTKAEMDTAHALLSTAAKLTKYVQLLARSDAAIETDNSTELTAINADGGSGAGDFSSQTDSGEANRDRMDTAHALLATPAQVNTEVSDVIKTDTYTLPGQEAPTATPTLEEALMYLFKQLTNKETQTATDYKLFARDETTVDQKATVSDDGTTYTKGEMATGP